MFRDSFISFLDAHSLRYVADGDLFFFVEYHLEIALVHLSDFADGAGTQSFGKFPALDRDIDRLYLYEDRWFSDGDQLRTRILARLGRFHSLFARKCNILSGPEIAQQVAEFLDKYHAYGNAQCKHRYALIYDGAIVAVATFSKPRPMPREDGRTYLSFEWVRYASTPGCRVVGGMGKLMNAFLKDAVAMGDAAGMPVEVMSYSDNEWSVGDVYVKLGFREIGERAPVRYMVDKVSYQRHSLRKFSLLGDLDGEFYEIYNRGSKKFLLKK